MLAAVRNELATAGADTADLEKLFADAESRFAPEVGRLPADRPKTVQEYSGDEQVVTVRDRELRTVLP